MLILITNDIRVHTGSDRVFLVEVHKLKDIHQTVGQIKNHWKSLEASCSKAKSPPISVLQV